MQNTSNHQTPHLTTANTGPLNILEKHILEKEKDIEQWFEQQWQLSPAPIYGSVDLRNAGFKLAPVDMNLFPAGFNNLNPDFLPISIAAARQAFHQVSPTAKKILIIPESHTRNTFYWTNIQVLTDILTQAAFDVRLGTLNAQGLETPTGLKISSLVREGSILKVDDFTADIILLNNDLSEGIPAILNHLQQRLVPPAELGWHQRLKSGHFKHYADITDAFARLINIDPWFIAPLFKNCYDINFMSHEGIECLESNVHDLLLAIQKKYDTYKIQEKPFVVIKADAGTYGMAVMTVRSAIEISSLNRKQRSHMAKTKGNQAVSQVIMQEGVYTFETWSNSNAVAEPVVYLWGQRVVGGFYRVHKDRGIDENLNSPGMHFEPLAFAKTCHEPAHNTSPGECQNRFYVYGVVARLSMLAAAREMLEQAS